MIRYFRIIVLNFQRAAEIRSRSFVWFLLSLFPPLTLIVFWSGATSGGKVIDGWTFPMLASYYLYIMIATVLTMSHIEDEVANLDIKEGGISPYLLKPFSYYWLKLFLELPYRVIQGGFGIITMVVIAFFARDLLVITTSVQTFLLALVMLVLAYIVSFTFKMLMSLIAFWMTETRGIFEVMEVLILIAGGTLMPIAFFPDYLQTIINATPMAYVIYYPVIALQGQLTIMESLRIIGIQLLWIIGLGLLYRWVWRAGVKAYAAIGQ